MSKFSVQQKATIDSYRTAKNLGFVVTDEYIAELIKKEMEKSGTVYPGFEGLAKSVAKIKVKQPLQNEITSVNTTTTNSIFGTQVVDNGLSLGFSEKNDVIYPKIKPTESQSEAISFLKDLTGDAETTFKNREEEAGALSYVVNTWQEAFNKEYAKSTVKKELDMAKEDLKLLEQASQGQLVYTDILGNTNVRSFEDVFKQRRGVKFDEKAVADCTEKAEQFAAIKTSVEMINKTKETLGYTTKGDVHSQMTPQESSAAIVKAFQLSGVNSLDEMNKTLKDIEEKYKSHPDIQKYGGDFKFAKNEQGKYVIYRTAKNGTRTEATNEQLRVIAEEMGLRLDKALATALGVEYSEDATAQEMAELTQKTYEKYQKEYEDSFTKAYGKKDVKALSEAYVSKQQQGVANIEMGLNIASMALMVVPGGAVATSSMALKGALVAKHSATGAKIVKGLGLIDKSKTFVKGAQTLQKVSQVASPFVMANMTLRPTELLEQLTSENGMSAEEWQAWGESVLQNSVYMAAGMGASKLAETGAAMYKTKALVKTLKAAGKSGDEITAMVKANPVKFPNEIVKSLDKVDNLAKTLQVSSEVALDIGSTVLVNKAMGNGDLLPQDVINSVAFAISGGVLQKQFAPLSTESKVAFIENALKDYGVTKTDAERILKSMDDISAGKLRAKEVGAVVKNNAKENEITKKITDTEIRIPKGRFASDVDVTERFKDIIYKNKEKFKTLSSIQDQKIFIERSYKIFLEGMGIDENIAPKLDFTRQHPNARACYSDTDNTLYIIGKNFPKDKSVGLGIIAHELTHFLQFKDELLTYSDDSLDGFMNLIVAKVQNELRQHPEKDYDETFTEILEDFSGFHVQAIISSQPPISPDSPKGQLVKKYLENEANYINKTESLSIDGTLKSYEDQLMEAEAYSTGDVVATMFNKEILGFDSPVYTRESSMKAITHLDDNIEINSRQEVEIIIDDKGNLVPEIHDLDSNPNIAPNKSAEVSSVPEAPVMNLYKLKLSNGQIVQVKSEKPLTQVELNKIVSDYMKKSKRVIADAREVNNEILKEALNNTNDDVQKTRIKDLDSMLSSFSQPFGPHITSTLERYRQTKDFAEIEQLELYLQAVSELNGKSVNLYNIGKLGGNTVFLRSNLASLSHYSKTVDKMKLSDLQKAASENKLPSRYQKGRTTLVGDINLEQRWASAFLYMKKYPNTEVANKFYNHYLASLKKWCPPEITDKLTDIEQKYRVKITLPSGINIPNCKDILAYIDDELSKWDTASGGSAKMPPMIEFHSIGASYHFEESAGIGKGFTIGGSSFSEFGGSLMFPELNMNNVKRSLRHELTHTNDLKLGKDISEKYNLDEIIPHKEKIVNGKAIKTMPNIDECKYANEFRNAGIWDDNKIRYAHTNTKEFIAVASEGNLSAYSSEFKQLLIDFGMPEWQFDLDKSIQNKITKEYLDALGMDIETYNALFSSALES